jgi:hypothetical protein
VELRLSLSSNSARRRSSVSRRARMAAWASGGTRSQSGSRIGGESLMRHGIRDVYGSSNTQAMNGYS